MRALADTQRTLDWDDLPPSVRDIPAGFDPTASGVLMAQQSDWIRLIQRAQIAVCEKGRRTGITFATATSDTITAASAKAAGGDNVWYMADTREKGLEYIGYCARFAQIVARGQYSAIEQHIFHDQDPETGASKDITAYRLRFASGYRITALASRPETIHGLQGIVNLDEAALHRDVSAVLESATALLVWGGRIRVWSTHRGKQNPFWQLVKDVRAGLYGDNAKVIRISFDDAVANGLYARVCFMQGKEVTDAGKKEWYTGIRAAYGPRVAAMREELDVIPRDGAGVSIPGIWIESAMPEPRPVLRIALPDDFAARPERERRSWADDWIARHLTPLLQKTDRRSRYALGMDFARHRHFSIIMPAQITPMLHRRVPWLIEMANCPTRQQEQILWAILDHWRDAHCQWSAALDATGPGQTLAEYTGDRYGSADPAKPRSGGRIHEVVLSQKWYGEWMQPWIDSFQDQTASYPRDASLEGDFRAVEDIDGVPRVPKVERKDIKDADLYRHGDGAIAAALMWYVSLHASTAMDWTPAPNKDDRRNGAAADTWHDQAPERDVVAADGKAGGW
jgi:phage FluMu gp28-like protein